MNSVWNYTCAEIRETTASDHPTTTSGTITIMTAVYACCLLEMSMLISLKKVKGKTRREKIEQALTDLAAVRQELSDLANKELAVFNEFLASLKIPKNNTRTRARSALINMRKLETIRVPMETCNSMMKVLRSIVRMIPLCTPALLCDLAVAGNFISMAVANLGLNINENARTLLKEKRTELAAAVKKRTAESNRELKRIHEHIRQITGD